MAKNIAVDRKKSTKTDPKAKRARVAAKIMGGFQGDIQPVKTSLTYRLGILLVAIVMVILPLIYIAIIGIVGYGVYYHTVNHTAVMAMGRGRGRVLAVMLYFAPIIIGAILVLFMFKPLLSRPAKRRKPRSLSRDEEPLLFAFVERICQAVGAPRPRRIDIDGEVNASASFRSGLFSMLGNDLVLTIGMPLVAGLTLRQFAGVLAHEFGHFSQGLGMRLTYIIRSISHWFTRVVYERDHWYERLVEWAEGVDMRIGWIFYLARLFVWMTRKILWVLMMAGHLVSAYMLRQMEFDADRYEARLAGCDAFAATARQLAALGIATQVSHSDLESFYREGRLGDNLPQLIVHHVKKFTPKQFSKIDKLVFESKTNLLDSHPCDSERVANAKREATDGIFQLKAPASVLFENFDKLCRQSTWGFYKEIFGKALKKDQLHPMDELLERQGRETAAYEALQRYFQATYRYDRGLQLPAWHLDTNKTDGDNDDDVVVDQLKSLRKVTVNKAPAYRELCEKFDELKASERGGLGSEMVPFEEKAGQRLFTALSMLQTAVAAEKLSDVNALATECNNLLPVLKVVNSQVTQCQALLMSNGKLAAQLNRLASGEQDESFIRRVQQQLQEVHGFVVGLRNSLLSLKYPFDHAQAGISVGEFAVSDVPDPNNPGEVYHAGDSLVGALHMLSARITGRLCSIAEDVEQALGMEPLPEPANLSESANAEAG